MKQEQDQARKQLQAAMVKQVRGMGNGELAALVDLLTTTEKACLVRAADDELLVGVARAALGAMRSPARPDPPGRAPRRAAPKRKARPGTSQDVLELLGRKPGLTRPQVAAELGIKPMSAGNALQRLKRNGLVKSEGPRHAAKWSPGDQSVSST